VSTTAHWLWTAANRHEFSLHSYILCAAARGGKSAATFYLYTTTPVTFPGIPEKNLFNRDKSSKLPESLKLSGAYGPGDPD